MRRKCAYIFKATRLIARWLFCFLPTVIPPSTLYARGIALLGEFKGDHMAWPSTSPASRGYGSEWVKLRKIVMQRALGLCQCDKCLGGILRVTAATDCDHIIPKARGGTDDLSNLRALSKECHDRVTLEQQGKTQKPARSRFGRDGRVVW